MLETTLRPSDTSERCGFLLTNGKVVELDNVASEPERGYEIDPVGALPYVKAKTIAATWHTHPDGLDVLSEDDWEGFLLWPDLEHYVIGRRGGEVVVHRYRVEDGLVIECD